MLSDQVRALEAERDAWRGQFEGAKARILLEQAKVARLQRVVREAARDVLGYSVPESMVEDVIRGWEQREATRIPASSNKDGGGTDGYR